MFSQLIAFLPDREFRRCVARYDGDARLRGFSCWDQYLTMAFAQLTFRESLRDIEACLRALGTKLYHMGFQSKVARSTLADANESRDWHIFADFAQHLIGIARPLHAGDPIGLELDHTLYALASSTIDLCLSLFPWAKFRQQPMIPRWRRAWERPFCGRRGSIRSCCWSWDWLACLWWLWFDSSRIGNLSTT